MKNAKAAGTRRELQVVAAYQSRGYVAFRSPASLGIADVIALKAGEPTEFVEVKANKGSPWMNFGREKRAELSAGAAEAGAKAVLLHWPPHGEPRHYSEDDWPERRRVT